MSVKLNPSNQLGFNRPFTQVVQRKLTITNHNSQPVGFEVKTTAPEFYTAIPNSGVIKPGDSVDVQVLLMAMREDPPLSHKCKDKFLVESMIIPPNRLPKSIYDMVHYPFTMRNLREDQKRPEIHQQKIKVVYLLPEEEVLEEEDSPQKIEAAYLPSEEQPPLCIRACPITMGDIPGLQHFSTTREGGSMPAPIPSVPPIPPVPLVPPAPVPSSISSLKPQHEGDRGRGPSPGLDYTSAEEDTCWVTIKPLGDKPPHQPHGVDSTAFAELNHRYTEAMFEIDRLQGCLASIPLEDATDVQKGNSVISDDKSIAVGTVTIVAPQPRRVPLYLVVLLALLIFVITYVFF